MQSTRYSCYILMEFKFSRQSFGKSRNIKFYHILPVEVKLIHAEGETDTMKLTVAFRNFANVPNNKPVTKVM